MVLSLFTKLQLHFDPISCPFPNCAYTQTTLIHMLQSPLSSFSSYHSSCTMSSANWHLMTTVQLPMVHFIFPECPGLAALLSLASVVEKQRQSAFTIQRPIHSPALPTLQHVPFKFVNLASTVLDHLQVQAQVKISLLILFVLNYHKTRHARKQKLPSGVL